MVSMDTRYKIGDIVEGTVTGIQKYGIFVQLDESNQGLIHISECQHGFVSELEEVVSIGERIKVMVIDVDEYSHKISLSLRQLVATSTPPFPARMKHKPRRRQANIGFKTIEKMMPTWIEEGLRLIEEDGLNLNKNKTDKDD